MWIGFGIFNLIEEDKIDWNDYGYLVIGMLYMGQYLYEISNQYLTIEQGILIKNSIIRKKIKISDIIRIKKFTGDYTLKTKTEELKINTQLIEAQSLAELNKILGNLKLPDENTPFAHMKL